MSKCIPITAVPPGIHPNHKLIIHLSNILNVLLPNIRPYRIITLHTINMRYVFVSFVTSLIYPVDSPGTG